MLITQGTKDCLKKNLEDRRNDMSNIQGLKFYKLAFLKPHHPCLSNLLSARDGLSFRFILSQ